MPLRFLFIFVLVTLACALVEARESGDDNSSAKLEAGVPRELARRRAAHYRDVRYALDITLTPGAELLKGRLKINVTLDAGAGDLVLDWRVANKEVKPEERVSDLKANGNPVADARFVNDHIIIPRAHLKSGENVIEMSFASPIATSGSAVTRYLDREDKSEYIYTLFVPSDASTAFPCFDQPDLKARFQLNIATLTGWTVVSNTSVKTVTRSGTNSFWRFSETKPISTYLFAFAAGPFTQLSDDSSPYGTILFVRRSKAERARKEINEVFRLNRGALKFFEGYFDHKFPFPKYDLAARADVMFHEAAHQWFGDLVTMRWFDDLWLKEGFATFMSYKALEALMPEFDAWKVFHLRNKPLAYLTDVTKGTTPIWQEIANLSAAKSAYGNIVYRKAPSILRQAEFYLGPPEFQKAVRLVVKEHAYANAEWADLVRAFERASGKKLDAWADAWVKRRGMPDVRVKWSADERGRLNSVVVNQRDALGEGGVWPMRVRMLLASTDNAPPETLTVLLSGETSSVKEALGKREPAFVFANFEDYGYGRFLLDDRSRANVTRHLGSVKDDFLRALLWDTLWESVREAELAPADFIELAVAHAAREERDDVALQFVLARAQVAFLRYLSDAQRRELAPRLEGMIYERMLKAGSAGARITYYRAYREIATTPDALDKLKRMLAGTLQAPGITLRSRDRFDIARALLSQRGAGTDEEVEALFKATVGRDTTDDGRRYAYAAEAARPLASVKQKYFAQYLNDKDVPESWIEASFGPLNAGQHAALTLPLLEPALRELPNLKRARKIFFVNGWLAAFIGGQCSAEAAGIVRDFLAREQTLDRDLRLKVLEAADGLERCVRVRAKYAGDTGGKPRLSP